ncbi:hypothetical protein [Lacipirellula parvula]|uniref:Uncharacterized protein n=1 Tax=Lacipirellula parvula TaxID=2650471 RepID=A0A5K7X8Y0_9BACT|nr:hypothetical protein [Lacipirellula parvula]BBO31221.1 hypothetical protein PLANPX_0833 [Lacipirellula parvula]
MSIEQEIRQYLAKRFQCDPVVDVQIYGDVVDVRGTMPNTHAHGQFCVGSLDDIENAMRRESATEVAVEA